VIVTGRALLLTDQYRFMVSSMGSSSTGESCHCRGGELAAFAGRPVRKGRSLPDLVLRILYRVTLHYLEHLRIMTPCHELDERSCGQWRTGTSSTSFPGEEAWLLPEPIHSNGRWR